MRWLLLITYAISSTSAGGEESLPTLDDVLAQLEAERPVENHESKLTAFYQEYNPEKMADVPKLLKKFKGREDAMFSALEEKYARVWGSANGDVKHLRESTFGRFISKDDFEKVLFLGHSLI